MKILNLYSGIGGNRKLWGDEHDITAVEYDEEIARAYKDFFPKDNMIIGDAHAYLLDNYKHYDFIWSSPPCPSHSIARTMAVFKGQNKAIYPDMTLYQEIILLERFHKKGGGYVIENVKPYYKPLIPALERDRHLFWSNFYIPEIEKDQAKHELTLKEQEKILGFNTRPYTFEKRKVLRNCVMPSVGKFILDSFIRQKQGDFFR